MTTRPQSSTGDEAIVIVSNRGPHDFVWEEGRWVAKPAAGGLVSMIEPLARQPNVVWFCVVSEPAGSESAREGLYTTAKDQIDPELNVVPVPLPAHTYHDYYGTISNEVLWMVQHHLVGQYGYSSLDHARHVAWDTGYMEANRRIVDAIAATEIPIRAFLIQDYHLYPLASLLRERFPSVPSLHFVHIPWPDPTMLRLLPQKWRQSILRGLLGADVVGFQTQADVRSFLACCEDLLGATVDYHRHLVIQPGRNIRARAFPASTDPDAAEQMRTSEPVGVVRARLEAEEEKLTIIRVDRLDPSKNQMLGFTAFGRLLEAHPELHGRVRFDAFLVPSRTDLTVYREYRDAVYAEIERVNRQWAEAWGYEPIRVFYTNDRAQAFAAMERCDALLVNSLEDGMNLVVKEWALVSRKPGVVIISETAGVTAEMGSDALQVSPLDVEGTSEALAAALAMPTDERARRLEALRGKVMKWTARDWLLGQLKELGLGAIEMPARAPQAPAAGRSKVGNTVTQELTVLAHEGLHARPAAAFVRCAREYRSEIVILREGQEFSAKSILTVLTANLNHGATFTLKACGPDAEEAVTKLTELLSRFAEDSGEGGAGR